MYGIYLHKNGLMFGNKCFDVDDTDNIIIDNIRYVGTPDLYELIFKRILYVFYMENDRHRYKICWWWTRTSTIRSVDYWATGDTSINT